MEKYPEGTKPKGGAGGSGGLSRKEGEQLLREGCERLGIRLSTPQVDRFLDYLALLKKWNRHLNLTSLQEDRDIIIKHFLDSLTPLPLIPLGASVMDVGSGAGFPGLPIQIVRPELAVTLIEASAKKISFLKEVCRRLSFKQTVVLRWYISQGAPPISLPLMDVAITRALGRPLEVLAAVYPYLKKGGKMIFMKGPKGLAEAETSASQMEKIGFTKSEEVQMTLPLLEQKRRLYILTKK